MEENYNVLVRQAEVQDCTMYADNFSEKGFWNKLRRLVRRAEESVVYVALVLFYTMKSDEVDIQQKLAIVGALGYLILPVDLIPDFIPVVGYADDFAAITAAYRMVKDSVTPSIREQATTKCVEWFTNFDRKKIEAKVEK